MRRLNTGEYVQQRRPCSIQYLWHHGAVVIQQDDARQSAGVGTSNEVRLQLSEVWIKGHCSEAKAKADAIAAETTMLSGGRRTPGERRERKMEKIEMTTYEEIKKKGKK